MNKELYMNAWCVYVNFNRKLKLTKEFRSLMFNVKTQVQEYTGHQECKYMSYLGSGHTQSPSLGRTLGLFLGRSSPLNGPGPKPLPLNLPPSLI